MNSFTWRYMGTVAGLALACYIAVELSQPFPYGNAPVSIVWLPTGIALAAILLGGYRLWPGIALGTVLAGIAHDEALAAIALNAFGDTLAATAGAGILQAWTEFDRRLRHMRDVLTLSGIGAMASAGISGAMKTFALYFSNQVELSVLGSIWAIAWLPDTLGVLLLTPMLLAWATEWRSRSWRRHTGEVALAFLALTLASGLSFGGWLDIGGEEHLPLAFLPFPFLMWIAMRLAMPWVVTATVLTAGLALVGTTGGHGPFAHHGATAGTAALWSFMVMVALTMLLVGVGMAERRRAEKRWVHAVESNPNAVVLADHAGRIVLGNSQTMRLFGYGRHELIGQPIEVLMPARFRERHESYRANFGADRPVRPMGMGRDLYAQRKDGTEFPVEVGLATIETEEETLTICAVADITLRKQAELALHEERNFVSAVLGTVAALVVVIDAEGRIVRLNRACEEITGYTLENVRGRPLEIFLPPEETGRVRETMDELLAGRAPQYLETYWLAKDGTSRLIAWSSTVLRGPDGSIQYLVGTGIDVTEQRRAEGQAIQRQAALAHIDRIAAAGELATSIAHELNQPLSAITTYCDTALALVQATPDPAAEVVYALDQACEQAERASTIIRHLRTFVRKGTTKRTRADVNAVIKDTVRFVETEARHRGVRIRLELAEALPPLLLDTVQIEQVLVNLLRNSFEAMAAADSPRREITIHSQRLDETMARITVHDTGPGLKTKTFDQLFDIFETTKSDGLGLGLSISRSIIEAHGGELWAEPASAQGATFGFTLPVTAENHHDGTATPHSVPG